MAVHAASGRPGMADGDCVTSFGGRLKELRLGCGYSLRRLGQSAHYSHGYLGELERGQKRPTAAVAAALDRALGADGQLSALAADLDAGSVVRDGGRLGVRGEAQTAWSGNRLAGAGNAVQALDAAGPTTVRVCVGAGAQVTVVCHDGAPGEVAVLAGPVRVLIDVRGTDEASPAAAAADRPSLPGMALVYSMAERRAG